MIDNDDRRAFEAATRGVKPLKRSNRVEPQEPRPPGRAGFRRAADAETLRESLYGTPLEPAADEVAFRRAGVSDRAFRELKRGRFSLEDEIDLHGFNRLEAKAALKEFLAGAAARGLGCVRVIHGKGSRSGPDGPVLKSRVHGWLAQWDEVLAFASAHARHGGSGAVYVLLRSR
jgi:DNA-nicking Smr family endonuclease